jgi:hypothetical protein
METKINNRLAEHGLTADDLTQEEMTQLREEIDAEQRGTTILDGVLDNPSLMYRKALKEFEKK